MKDLRGKKILIIAAGIWQIPVIKKAKEMGLTVISTDRDSDAPGFAFADFHETVDIADINGTLRVAEKYRVDAVITEQTDMAVPTAAYVAEKLGLPGIGYDVALKSTNKYLMREACAKAGIQMPKYEKVDNIRDAIDAAEEIGYPLVLKPVSGQSSRGVFAVTDASEIKQFFEKSIVQSREKSILIEEKLEGIESTVEGFVTKEGPAVLAISEKKHLPPPHCIATTLLYAPAFSTETIALLHKLDKDIVEAIGISMGITHAEFIITRKGCFLVEIAARGGGTRIASHIVPAVAGVDITEGLITQSLGYDFQINKTDGKVAVLEFFVFPTGKVKRVEGIDRAGRFEGVIDLDIQLKEGDIIKPVEDDRGRHGYFIAAAQTREELFRIAEMIKKTIQVVTEPE